MVAAHAGRLVEQLFSLFFVSYPTFFLLPYFTHCVKKYWTHCVHVPVRCVLCITVCFVVCLFLNRYLAEDNLPGLTVFYCYVPSIAPWEKIKFFLI